jgi:hypothetical protein
MTMRYANAVAASAARAGKQLPDGSVILQVSYKVRNLTRRHVSHVTSQKNPTVSSLR